MSESHFTAESNPTDADWCQLEAFIERLHESALAPLEAPEFYRRLLEGCVTLLAAEGGTVWRPASRGQWRATHQINPQGEPASAGVSAKESANHSPHLALLSTITSTRDPVIIPPHSRHAGGENTSDDVLALVAVRDTVAGRTSGSAQAIVELRMRPGSSPAAQQGWLELLSTVSAVASEFHGREQLRTLQAERGFYDQSLALVRRFQQPTDLKTTAFEIANEGRRFVAADRLSVLVRRGQKWQLLAASGVDRIEARSDVAKRLEQLAAATAAWGEPLEHAESGRDTTDDLPPELANLIEQHLDESQARRLVIVPMESTDNGDMPAVLVAEQFSSAADKLSRQRVIELAGLCAPALRQAAQLDRFPVRGSLRWADRWAAAREKWGLTKLATASLAALAVLAALTLVKIDFEVEAPATLMPRVQRDVFATTDGKVLDVRAVHGQSVAAGEVLAVLHDPQLALDVERVLGEIEPTRKRLEAIAVARTDRRVREEESGDTLPLSAEAEQLKKRLASLRTQQQILAERNKALTLRSPIGGTVLTLDVQNLLDTRPVERGQVLFTIADTSAGWQLLAELQQDRIGQVVAAQEKTNTQLPVRFRLAGGAEATYTGHLESLSTVAVLDTADLEQASRAFEAVVAVDDAELPLARPGMNAQVRIHCGRRSLGYVWLHSVWDNLYSWWVF